MPYRIPFCGHLSSRTLGWLGAVAFSVGCTTAPDAEDASAFAPAAARLHRLTDVQWRNSVQDLTGVVYSGTLPGDYVLHGYANVGSAEATLSPVELEEVETAVWSVVATAVPDQAAALRFVGCDIGAASSPVTVTAEADPCLRGWVTALGGQAWRRPIDGAEVEELASVYHVVGDGMSDDTLAVQAVLATVLLSPDFLYRVELGEPDADDPRRRRLSSYEVATRLAYFLTDAPPDEGLLQAAERGDLDTDAGLRIHTERLGEDTRSRDAMTTFFDQTMGLQDLDLVSKDTTLFPNWTPTLKDAMREEMHRIFQQVVLDEEQPVDALFTTNLAFLNRELGAVYGMPMTSDTLVPVTLPDRAGRGGILGRAAFLTLESHATFNSPTHRGRYVRTRLLCQDVPAPPPDIPTIDAVGTEGSLRQRLESHLSDPACAGCHVLMDPIGFGFENFNPLGSWVDIDNGVVIDATGDLDGQKFDGAAELGAALAAHADVPGCFVRNFYRSALGALEGEAEEGQIEALTDDFVDADLALRPLIEALVLSEGFRTIDSPANGSCDTDGVARACATACGDGVETCRGGVWTGCTATAPSAETCDGVDNDCDGTADEAVLRPCEGPGGPGVQECLSAQWQACDAGGGS